MKDRVIAIDGPSGSGKSTITKRLASELGFTYLDTGAMFRSLAYKLNDLNIDFCKPKLDVEEAQRVRNFLEDLNFEYAPDDKRLIVIDNEDLTDRIREHRVSSLASRISKFSIVRNYLADTQRQLARKGKVILEGRDIGTVIFPNAALKFFLTADAQVRAQRRLKELQEKDPAFDGDLAKIKADVEKRDREDTQREHAPLKKASDAVEIDTSHLSVDQVIQKMKEYYHQRQEFFS